MTDNIYHNQHCHGGKHWVQKPKPISYTRHVIYPPYQRPYGNAVASVMRSGVTVFHPEEGHVGSHKSKKERVPRFPLVFRF